MSQRASRGNDSVTDSSQLPSAFFCSPKDRYTLNLGVNRRLVVVKIIVSSPCVRKHATNGEKIEGFDSYRKASTKTEYVFSSSWDHATSEYFQICHSGHCGGNCVGCRFGNRSDSGAYSSDLREYWSVR